MFFCRSAADIFVPMLSRGSYVHSLQTKRRCMGQQRPAFVELVLPTEGSLPIYIHNN